MSPRQRKGDCPHDAAAPGAGADLENTPPFGLEEADDGVFIPSGVPDEDWLELLGAPSRCPTCGSSVFLPCIACETRFLLAEYNFNVGGRPRSRAFIVGLDLLPCDFARYLEVRRYRRMLEGDEPSL
jgi:hypothetical protein